MFKKKESLAPDLNFDMNNLNGSLNMNQSGLNPSGFDPNQGFDTHNPLPDLGNFNNPQSINTPSSATNLSSLGMQSQQASNPSFMQNASHLSEMGGGGQSYAQYPPSTSGPDIQKDLQILSLKLDAIKSELDSVNQRVATIERIALKDEQQMQQKRWY
ncbi:MAG: hypothetical protein WC916_06410 [Candidatus Woesearchaeota archaeon]